MQHADCSAQTGVGRRSGFAILVFSFQRGARRTGGLVTSPIDIGLIRLLVSHLHAYLHLLWRGRDRWRDCNQWFIRRGWREGNA